MKKHECIIKDIRTEQPCEYCERKFYRQAQFNRLKNDGVYSSSVQFWDGSGNKTNSMHVTEAELQKIKAILTK